MANRWKVPAAGRARWWCDGALGRGRRRTCLRARAGRWPGPRAREQALGAGTLAVLEKPFTAKDLLDAVDQAVRQPHGSELQPARIRERLRRKGRLHDATVGAEGVWRGWAWSSVCFPCLPSPLLVCQVVAISRLAVIARAS